MTAGKSSKAKEQQRDICVWLCHINYAVLTLPDCFTHLESIGAFSCNAYFYAGERRFRVEFLTDHHLVTVYGRNVKCLMHQ